MLWLDPVLFGLGAVKIGRCLTCDVAPPKTVIAGLDPGVSGSGAVKIRTLYDLRCCSTKTVIAGLDPAIQPSAGALPGPWMCGSILGSTARGKARA